MEQSRNCQLDKNSLIGAIANYRHALALEPSFVDSRISLASCLRDLGHFHLAYATLKSRYCTITKKEERQRLLVPLVEAILALNSQSNKKLKPEHLEAFLQLVEREVHQQVGNEDPCRAGILLTQLWLQVEHLDRALSSRNKLIEDTNRFFANPEKKHLNLKKHSTLWNAELESWDQPSKKGRFKDGWNLFEYGLQVPAPGPQRWQRSLKKPFTP